MNKNYRNDKDLVNLGFGIDGRGDWLYNGYCVTLGNGWVEITDSNHKMLFNGELETKEELKVKLVELYIL